MLLSSASHQLGIVVACCRCCICQLEFEDEDEATPLPCKHCYHSECVKRWLQQSKVRQATEAQAAVAASALSGS